MFHLGSPLALTLIPDFVREIDKLVLKKSQLRYDGRRLRRSVLGEIPSPAASDSPRALVPSGS